MTIYEQLQQKNSQISSVEGQISSKNTEKSNLITSIAQLVTDIATNTTTISTLQAKIGSEQQQIIDYGITKTNLLAEISDLQSQVDALIILRDAAYTDMTVSIDIINGEISDLESQISAKNLDLLIFQLSGLNNDLLQFNNVKENLTYEYHNYNIQILDWIMGLRNRTWDFNHHTTQLAEILTDLGFTSYEEYRSGINVISFQNDFESVAFGVYVFNGAQSGLGKLGLNLEIGDKMSRLIDFNYDSNGNIISAQVKSDVINEMVKSSFKEYLFDQLFNASLSGGNMTTFDSVHGFSFYRSELGFDPSNIYGNGNHKYDYWDIYSGHVDIFKQPNYQNFWNQDGNVALIARILGDINYIPKYQEIESTKYFINDKNSVIIDNQSVLLEYTNRRDELVGTTASVGLIADVTSQIDSLNTLIDNYNLNLVEFENIKNELIQELQYTHIEGTLGQRLEFKTGLNISDAIVLVSEDPEIASLVNQWNSLDLFIFGAVSSFVTDLGDWISSNGNVPSDMDVVILGKMNQMATLRDSINYIEYYGIEYYGNQIYSLNNLLLNYNNELSPLESNINDLSSYIQGVVDEKNSLEQDLLNLGELENPYTLWTNFMGAYDLIYSKIESSVNEATIIRQISNMIDGNDVPDNGDNGVVSLLRLYKYLSGKAPVNRFNRQRWNYINYSAVPLVKYFKSFVKDTSIEKTPVEQDNMGIYEIPYGNKYVLLDFNYIDVETNRYLWQIKQQLRDNLYSLISDEGIDMSYSIPNGYISGN